MCCLPRWQLNLLSILPLLRCKQCKKKENQTMIFCTDAFVVVVVLNLITSVLFMRPLVPLFWLLIMSFPGFKVMVDFCVTCVWCHIFISGSNSRWPLDGQHERPIPLPIYFLKQFCRCSSIIIFINAISPTINYLDLQRQVGSDLNYYQNLHQLHLAKDGSSFRWNITVSSMEPKNPY